MLNKIITILFCILLNSCAVLLNHHPNRVSIKSFPDSSNVYLGDSLIGITPIIVNLSDTNENYLLSIRKESYKNINLYVNKEYNTAILLLDLWGFYPFIISKIIGYSYKSFSPKHSYLLIEKINQDSISNPLFANLGNNFIMTEFTPFYALLGAYVTLSANYYKDLFDLSKSYNSVSNIGLKGGWGWGGIGFLNTDGKEGFGYNLMPSYSYEKINYFNNSIDKFIISLGASYTQSIYYTTYPYNMPPENFKGFRPAISYQSIITYPIYNIFWGYSLGYINAVNYFQFSFGYRF